MHAETEPQDDEPIRGEYLYDYAEGARYLRLSVRTVQTLVAQHAITHLKLGRRIYFRRTDLEQYLEHSVVPARLQPHTGGALHRSHLPPR